MGNMCCRRVVYSPNGVDSENRCHQQQQQQPQKTQTMSTAYHNAGDDCAINELLEGRMDLDVILPDGRQVRLTVERRTPMMDLLVQAASATKISPGGHVIHVFGDGGKESGTLQYKPSTPIGSLDANTIFIVPKKEILDPPGRRMPKVANRPFEPTFRVQVHLPRNQLTVARVSPRVKISELRSMVCREKGLDMSRYQLVRPSDPTQALTGDMTLSEYGSTEITLLSNSCIESNICNSTSHIIPYSKRDEQKKKTGILRLLAEDANHKDSKSRTITYVDGNQRLSQTKTDHPHQGRYKPKKRRPAPPPPPPTLPETPFHSRQSSSDSSGYHEATSSFFHEDHSSAIADKASSDSSGVSSLDAKVPVVQAPAPPVPNLKKRKAPPPPPPQSPTTEKDPVIRKELDQVTKPWQEESYQVQSEITTATARSMDASDDKLKADNATEGNKTPIPVVVELTHEIPSPVNNTEHCERLQDSKDDENGLTGKSEAVTRVALAALNARIEQDVTQQEIASSIQAAFHSLDCPQRIEPSLLAIKQRNAQKEVSEEVHNGAEKICPPPVQQTPNKNDNALNILNGNTCISSSPPSKTTVRISLNLETKERSEKVVELPSPLVTNKFESIENEALVIDDEPLPPPSPFCSSPAKHLKRSSSLLSLAEVTPKSSSKNTNRIRHLQRSLSDLSTEDKGEFEAEQERLQREYIKLQRQFIVWQQQLLSNHAMLREECIVPQYARTLRQSHSLPEGENYSTETSVPCPRVSRSLSYEPTNDRCSTLPRSTINIPSLEFGSVPVSNGSSTLRSSKTKSYFKPPQVRTSTKSRQRLPPEIRKEGDLDITDDMKMLTTILPSFESLKLISENNVEDIPSGVSRLKNGPLVDKVKSANFQVEGKATTNHAVPTNQIPTFPKPSSRINNGDRNVEIQRDKNQKFENGDTGQSKRLSDCPKVADQTSNPQPLPPPPLPEGEVSKGSTVQDFHKPSGHRNGVERKNSIPQLDPREQLMLEIRKFGGRTALRKISLAS